MKPYLTAAAAALAMMPAAQAQEAPESFGVMGVQVQAALMCQMPQYARMIETCAMEIISSLGDHSQASLREYDAGAATAISVWYSHGDRMDCGAAAEGMIETIAWCANAGALR